MRAVAILLTLSFFAIGHSRVEGGEFHPDDKILILVSGPTAASTPWGLSGTAAMYRATSTQSSGNFGFTKVDGTENVACERRSAKKVTEPFDYSSSGQIPPGVYFVSYHRLDPMGNRHRLAIGDLPSATTIQVSVGDKRVTRTDIQFHEAANNLRTYTPRLSEGCIIFSDANFRTLFPAEFLDSATSPLAPSEAKNPSAKGFKGKGHVLVFVTDVTDATLTEKQQKLFESLCGGGAIGLNEESFAAKSKSLATIRLKWQDK